MAHLPMNRSEMADRGWDQLDFLFVSGDAYVDHPSFGVALLSRLLEDEGYRVGIIAQPSINDDKGLLVMGQPRLAVLVSSGVVDSMVDNYTASGKPRSNDRYSPGGTGGLRPDRAMIRYCNMVRAQLGDIPLIIGGVEASLRRFAHYDYWSNKIRRTILQDSQADILVYGMGELPLLEIARLLNKGVDISKINSIRGTCVLTRQDRLPAKVSDFIDQSIEFEFNLENRPSKDLAGSVLPEDEQSVWLPSFDDVCASKAIYAIAFRYQYREQDPGNGKVLVQRHSGRYLVQNPPARPMKTAEIDRIYDLPYERTPHPLYAAKGGVPSIDEVRFSINSHRGCFGGCHFCAITFHQGRIVQGRSKASILKEAELITNLPDFKGYIHDVGGPTANFYKPACKRQQDGSVCKNRQCMFPEPCPSLNTDQHDYLDVLRAIRELPSVKKVFVRSGIRFDYMLLDHDNTFFDELCEFHISGQLKVAPEHISQNTLRAMGKPGPKIYKDFRKQFADKNKKLGMKQYLVPYLISGHPGCDLDDAIELAMEIKASRVMPEQVQDFYPTPGTISTVMYYTGLNPINMQAIHVPDQTEKILQRALLQFGKPDNRDKVLKALRLQDREDLIGYGPDKLVPDTRFRKPAGRGKTDRIKSNREAKKHGNHHQRQGSSENNSRTTGRRNFKNQGRKSKTSRPGRHSGR